VIPDPGTVIPDSGSVILDSGTVIPDLDPGSSQKAPSIYVLEVEAVLSESLLNDLSPALIAYNHLK
ncbi:MAG: hypothetical protein P1U34_08980, partial [Coxiellaceae bacterium]|nr:hypothetical protein [Coxiellaceae bacterium]